MGKTPHYLRTFKVTPRRHLRDGADVGLAQLARDIDRGYRFFCAARGINPETVEAYGTSRTRPRTENNDAAAVATHYLALDGAPAGSLRRMAANAGLPYSSVWSAVLTLRRARKARRDAA